MKTQLIVLMTVGMLAVGCGKRHGEIKSPESDSKVRIKRYVRAISGPLNFEDPLPKRDRTEDVIKAIVSLPDKSQREQLLISFATQLLSVDLSGLSYREQDNRMRWIEDAVRDVIIDALLNYTDASLESIYELRFALLDWMKAQLRRMRPTREYKFESVAKVHTHSEWRVAYLGVYFNLRANLYYLENPVWMIDRDLCHRQGASRQEIIKKVEAYLGHPLRTGEELESILHFETEDFKKVHSHKYTY